MRSRIAQIIQPTQNWELAQEGECIWIKALEIT